MLVLSFLPEDKLHASGSPEDVDLFFLGLAEEGLRVLPLDKSRLKRLGRDIGGGIGACALAASFSGPVGDGGGGNRDDADVDMSFLSLLSGGEVATSCDCTNDILIFGTVGCVFCMLLLLSLLLLLWWMLLLLLMVLLLLLFAICDFTLPLDLGLPIASFVLLL